jgi:hypothetical protein
MTPTSADGAAPTSTDKCANITKLFRKLGSFFRPLETTRKDILEALELSSDRKVTPVARFEMKKQKGVVKPFWKVIVKNTIGTLAGTTCAMATEFCLSICYAFRVEAFYPNAKALVGRNTDRMRSGNLIEGYQGAIDEYRKQMKLVMKRKLPFEPKNLFRHHYDGDIDSFNEARAIRAVAVKNPDIIQWIYTRRFDLAPSLLGVPNLKVYLSVDKDNWKFVPKGWVKDGGMLALTATTWEETEKLSRLLLWRNSPACPELTGKLPLVVDRGDGYGEGACAACGMCPNGINHVRFSTTKK